MAKKNYRPTAAARKKVEEKRLAQKQAKRLAIWQQYKKQIIIAAVAVVAAIIVLALAIDYFYVPSGSLRTFLGKPEGIDETSVVREMNGNYYEFARMTTPEGYEVADYGMELSDDPNERYLYFETADEARAINNVYVCGVEDRTGSEMLSTLSTSGIYTNFTEPQKKTIGGVEVDCMYTCTELSDEEGNPSGEFYASLIMYADTIKDSTVLVNCSSSRVPEEELPTEEAMYAEIEAILSCLTMP